MRERPIAIKSPRPKGKFSDVYQTSFGQKALQIGLHRWDKKTLPTTADIYNNNPANVADIYEASVPQISALNPKRAKSDRRLGANSLIPPT